MKRKIKRHDTLFSRQLFFSIFSASFLLLVVGLLILYRVSAKSATDINNAMKQSTLMVTGENLDRALARVDDTVRSAFFQQNMLNCMAADFSKKPAAYSTVRHAIVTAVASDDLVSYMGLYDSIGGKIKTTTIVVLPYQNYEEGILYYEAHSHAVSWNNSTWYFLEKDPLKQDEYALANVREIKPLSQGNRKKIFLAIYLSEEKLSKIYDFLGQESYIMAQDGTIVSAVNKTAIGTAAPENIRARVAETAEQSAFLLRDRQNFYYSVYLPSIRSYLIVNSGSEVLQVTNHMITWVSVLLVTFGLLFSLLWAQYISGLLARPVTELKTTMEQARGGNLSIRSHLERRDEIGYLSDSFNHMMDSLAEYLVELNRQQDLTKESELRLLQTQINPHLLYNTLDSALYLLEENDAPGAVRILEELSQFFKLSLQSGNKVVSVEMELQHVASYLNLQNLCRMKNFMLRITGDAALRKTPILHMLLQPIVENAVLHGFDGNFPDGTISIDLRQEAGVVVITVADDGVGMEDAELQTIRQNLCAPEPAGGSFALWNIAKRMKMFYGEAFGIQVDSEFGEYTAVTLRIPGMDAKEENHV